MKDNVKSIGSKLFIRYPKLENCKKDFVSVFDYINECYNVRGKLLVCGNGNGKSLRLLQTYPAVHPNAEKQYH